jgi:circadian clock protein KaiB
VSEQRFAAELRRSGEMAEVLLRGELDDASAAQARASVDTALAERSRTLVLDLGGLEFMDSAGIWLVIETHRRCVEADIDLRLAGERKPAVTHALELAGVESLIRGGHGNGDGDGDGDGGHGDGDGDGDGDGNGNGKERERVRLRLYLSSRSANGTSAAQMFRAAAQRLPAASLELEVIDVFDEPARAQRDRIIATPTLIKVEPQPELRLIGSIGDEEAILRYLGLRHLAA